MTLQKLASEIAMREGKKSQARIGDIREILKILIKMEVENVKKNGGDKEGSPLFVISSAILKKLKWKKK